MVEIRDVAEISIKCQQVTPGSVVVAVIQTSFNGMGVPTLRNAAEIRTWIW